MKTTILLLGCVAITCGFLAGCGESEKSSDKLNASDLALLTDFHAWKTSIPEAQQPCKAIRLVIRNRRDGTVVTKFSTGGNLKTNCSSFLLGIRVEQGRFTGHLLTRAADGGGLDWDLNFTDTLADSYPGWSAPGTLTWNGNSAQLATSTRSDIDDVLTIELDK